MAWTGAKRHYATLPEMLESESPRHRRPLLETPVRPSAADRGRRGEAGCHIYCEKPLSASLLEADRIVELAERARIRICMAHPGGTRRPFRTMKAMLEAGEIGRPLSVHGRGKCDHRGGGEDLIVLGTHILDLQVFFFGPPEYVYADITSDGRPIAVTDRTETVEPIGPAAGDSIFAHFRFPGDVRGVFESRRGLYRQGKRENAYGDHGRRHGGRAVDALR
jgi:predicted dehydrogenase